MDLGYNISFTLAALVIDVVLVLIMSINYSSTNRVNKRFRYFLIASMVMFVLNVATVITNAMAKDLPHAFNMAFNSLYFFSTVAVSVLFFYYCCSFALKKTTKGTRKGFYIANIVVLGIYAVALIVNCFTGFYFYFDYNAQFPYKHGWCFLPINLFSLVFVVESIVIFIARRKQFNTRQIICTTIFFVIFFIAYAMQVAFFSDVLLSDFGCAVGSLIVFFSIETPDYVKLMATLKELNDLKGSLEKQVEARTEELNKEKASYEELTLETLSALADLIDAKDHYTNGHSVRVATYSKALAKELGLADIEQEEIYLAGLIHDVGKIGIPEAILRKPGQLSKEEFAVIQSHASIGGDILHGIKEFPHFEAVAKHHHERYEGTGYPERLAGESIPYFARIVAICDSFDAMTSDRAYRKALSDKVALQELKDGKGTQFDPELVEAFLRLAASYPDSLRNHIDELGLS